MGNDSAAGAITEWYVNTAAGLEQGFTLESAPGERRDGERLRVVLALEGDLRAQAVDGGQALEFMDGAGQRVLRYDHLVVRDGDGARAGGPNGSEGGGRRGRGLAGSGRSRRRLAGDDRPDLHPAAETGGLGRGAGVGFRHIGCDQRGDGRGRRANGFFPGLGLCLCAQRWSLEPAAEAGGLGRGAGDQFGTSVAISGETVVVGAPMIWRSGLSRLGLCLCAQRWSLDQQQKLEASDAASGDQFGTSVAISGETVVVGAPDDGAAGLIKARLMSLCAAVESGASSRSWRPRTRRKVTGSAPRWRSAGRRSWSARRLLAQRSSQGSAYVFVRSGGVWSQQQKLEASDAAAGDSSAPRWRSAGRRSWSARRLLVAVNQGSAYVFVRSGGVWSQQQKLEASDATPGDQFGPSVAISGETVVVGAPVWQASTGAAYVFVRGGGVWTQQQKLEASTPTPGEQFGASVAISGDSVVAGAPLGTGAVYVFGPPPPPKTFYLLGAGPDNNPSVLFLDNSEPTAAVAKFRDSASLKFAGGNLWKEIGTWRARTDLTTGNLTALGDLHVWLGLKNSDDQGTRFDLRVEVYKNSGRVAVGNAFCIQGVTRNPNLAKEVTVTFDPFSPVLFDGADVMSLRVSARIGTNQTGGFCGGHSNAVGLRLYFEAISRAAQFSATFE